MKVVFRTNVDHYKKTCWPTNIEIPPRKGDTIMVTKSFESYYSSMNLPTRMEVVDVIWSESMVLCELWFCDIDVKAAKLSGTNLL